MRIAAQARRRPLPLACAVLALVVVAGVPKRSNAQGRATEWTVVSSPNEEGSNLPWAVDASADNDAWTVGWYFGAEGGPETLAEHWDGRTWSLVDIPDEGTNGSLLRGVAAVSPSAAWAVGYAYGAPTSYASTTVVEHWTGSAWSLIPSPNPSKDPIYGANQLDDVRAFAPDDVWAAGWQWVPSGSAPLIEHWDGRKWRVSPTPNDGVRQLQALDGTTSDDIWAVGYAFTFRHGYQPLAMHWDGSSWVVVPTPTLSRDSYLNDVAVVSPTDAWAVGYSLPRNGDIQPLVLHWDGSAWAVVPSPHLRSTYNYFQSVVAVSEDDVWAAGYRTVDGHQVISLVEHWDGSQWRLDRTSLVQGGGNYLQAMALDPAGGLWAAGYFYPDDFTQFRTLILHRSTA